MGFNASVRSAEAVRGRTPAGWLAGGGLLLLLGGCAGLAGPGPTDDGSKRMAALETRLSELGETLDKQGQRLDALDKRLEDVAGEARGSKVGPAVEKVKERLHRLEGSAEVNGHELERLSQQLEDSYAELDRRLAGLEKALARLEEEALSRSMAQSGAPDKDPGGGPAEGSSGSSAEKASAPPTDYQRYQAAFDRMKNGEYEQAAAAFQRFLGEFPDSQYADNARYWLGEAYYVQKDYERALQVFQRVQRQFPDSDKVPDALLKEGFAYFELQDFRMARKTLLEVTDRFPDHRVAKLARQRLDRIREERN